MSVQPIFDVCHVESHGRCNRVMIEQERLIFDRAIYPGWWHLQWRGPDLWRMWDREGDWPRRTGPSSRSKRQVKTSRSWSGTWERRSGNP